jgi:hypothetical protein
VQLLESMDDAVLATHTEARRVHDKQVLKLVRAYLEADVMAAGLVHATEEGTPQGSPLSPLLSNVSGRVTVWMRSLSSSPGSTWISDRVQIRAAEARVAAECGRRTPRGALDWQFWC